MKKKLLEEVIFLARSDTSMHPFVTGHSMEFPFFDKGKPPTSDHLRTGILGFLEVIKEKLNCGRFIVVRYCTN